MKQIQLQSLTLHNWRGEKERTTEFHTDAPTYICGGNGLGKSRHFDAFCWLLFGKDSQDRKDFELRTHDTEGNVLHKCECSVEAVILIDGVSTTLKREYKEKWTKPTGQIEEVFSGNVTECTWNGTPVKVGEFGKRVQDEIIDDTLFKMITNPRYFTEKMKWQQQRECLLQMAGTATDEEIAATSEDFKSLLDSLNGKSLSDFRKEIAAEKKRVKAKAAEVQPRIDQTHKMMPEAENWEELKLQINAAKNDIAAIDKQMTSADARRSSKNDAHKATQENIYSLQEKQRAVIAAYKKEQEAAVYEANEERRNIEAKLKTGNSDLSTMRIDIKRTEDRIAYLYKAMADTEKQLEELRHEWHEINASAYDGSDTCPHCGQRLPEEMISTAEAKFKQHKQDLLTMNNERGRALVAQQKAYKEEHDAKKKELDELQDTYKRKDMELQNLYEDLKDHPVTTRGIINNNEIPEYADLQAQIDTLEASLQKEDDTDEADKLNELASQRASTLASMYELENRLAKREQIDKANKEIARLNDEGRDLALQLADIEKREYIAAQFSKKKIEDCEQRINGLFSYVRFQLFDTTQDGNEFETCVPIIEGVPYGTKNTAGQVNAGLDIINTLCRFHNVAAPIFIDGAESVNDFHDVQSQTIFLLVTKDKELVIK